PFPVVEADGSRDDLEDLAGVIAAREPVFTHEPVPLLDGEGVPVVGVHAPFGHGVEADVAHPLRHLGEEADLYVSSRAFGVRHLLEELVEGLAPWFGLASRFGGCVVEPCRGHGGVAVLEPEERAVSGAANPEL